MQEVWLGDCLERMKDIDNGSIDLAVIDPPYFRILNEKWDKFKNKDAYASWSEEYLTILFQKIRWNGSIVLFGCSRSFNTVCLLVSLIELLGGEFIQEITIDKGMKSIAGRISNKIKMFPPVSENVILFRKNAKPFVKKLLREKQKASGLLSKEILQKLGLNTNGGGNWTKYCGDTEFPLFPTKEHWDALDKLFNLHIPYSTIKETYNGIFGLTNVWNDINFNIKPRTHPCEKPINLLERLITSLSDEKNLILDPFCGSGTTVLAAKNLGRQFIGIEKEKEYYDIILKRLQV